MAKKTSRKPAARTAKKTAKKKAPRRAGASPVAPAYPGNPKRINTGAGATPEEVGKQLVADFNRGKYEINANLWSPKLVCIEGGGMAWRGMKNVEAKNTFWSGTNTVLGAAAEGPYVGSTGFAVKFRMDVQDNSSGRRTIMEEVGVYTVKNGKIVQEEFMYGSMTPGEAAMPAPLHPTM
jgi:hypothetical protein